jgi:hypothetical protein
MIAASTGSGDVTLNFLILPSKTGQYQKSTLGPLSEGFVNCSEADTDTCSSLNRSDCGTTTDNTCGDCDAGYFGPEDDNSACTGKLNISRCYLSFCPITLVAWAFA